MEVEKGARFLEDLVRSLEDKFATVRWEQPLLIQWLFTIRTSKVVSLADYLVQQSQGVPTSLLPDAKRNETVIAVNIYRGLGWSWVDQDKFLQIKSPSGITGIHDAVLNRSFFTPDYKTMVVNN